MKPNKYNANTHTGRFNKRIALWGPVVTQDEIGNEIETFGEMRKVWAMIKTLKGSEYQAAAQSKAVNTTRFVVRYSVPLRDLFDAQRTKIEIRYKGVVYDIKSVINDDEMNETFTIVAEGRL